MPIRFAILAVFSTAFFVAVPCSAQNIKPGLWEINNKMQNSNGEFGQMMAMMQEQMARMTPDQRKSMEAMMASQGMQMPTVGAGGGVAVKMCLTREMVADNHLPIQQAGNCTHQRSPVVGNTMKISFSCTEPRASGDGQISFNGDAAYSMKSTIRGNTNGKAETMTVDSTGRWLGADCGSVKPVAMPKSK